MRDAVRIKCPKHGEVLFFDARDLGEVAGFQPATDIGSRARGMPHGIHTVDSQSERTDN